MMMMMIKVYKVCQTEGIWEQGAEENIGTKRDEVTGGLRKLHNE